MCHLPTFVLLLLFQVNPGHCWNIQISVMSLILCLLSIFSFSADMKILAQTFIRVEKTLKYEQVYTRSIYLDTCAVYMSVGLLIFNNTFWGYLWIFAIMHTATEFIDFNVHTFKSFLISAVVQAFCANTTLKPVADWLHSPGLFCGLSMWKLIDPAVTGVGETHMTQSWQGKGSWYLQLSCWPALYKKADF